MTGESDINDGVEINNWWLECYQGVPIGPPHTISAKIAIRDDYAEKFTSEIHDPCARSRYLQKRTKQEHLIGGTGVEPAKHPPKVKSEIFLQL